MPRKVATKATRKSYARAVTNSKTNKQEQVRRTSKNK